MLNRLKAAALLPVYWGRRPEDQGGPALILLPYSATTLSCGLAGLIALHTRPRVEAAEADWRVVEASARETMAFSLEKCLHSDHSLDERYLGGSATLERLHTLACALKREDHFLGIFNDAGLQEKLAQLALELADFTQQEIQALQRRLGRLSAEDADAADARIEKLKDVVWCLRVELLDNIGKVRKLLNGSAPPADRQIRILRNINAVLNSIDRQEVRGRDSAGISLLFIIDAESLRQFESHLEANGIMGQFAERSEQEVLSNKSITTHHNLQNGLTGMTFTYKVAAEIGRLGDNVRGLRHDIAGDPILNAMAMLPHRFHTASAHTRWASVGAITIANCHPVDNATKGRPSTAKGIIHVCLNGDIDNYLALKKRWAACGETIPEEITTDTKIIPLQIEHHLAQGCDVAEAFRRAVQDFEGSHAITMHTDLAPGKFFLAQRGSGQALFVGLAKDHYMSTSEVYGFVEETDRYIKLDGEKSVPGIDGPTQGQIFILDQESTGGLEGIQAMYYDGTPVPLTPARIQTTRITSRDIDRQNFTHYFLKEISEAPLSVFRTLQNRWKIAVDDSERHTIRLDESNFPESIVQALAQDRIRRIYFIGQGTAGVAAQVCADTLNFYLNEPALKVSAMKASELSGFQLGLAADSNSMADALVIAITQSGTTTDTNRAVDMARARGAHAMAIVNRRDSDITFKVHGVVYTSSGRDIEMSVASTKAFYSQIVAGALVSLRIAEIRQRRSPGFIDGEIKALLTLPDQMRRVLALGERIQASARRLAPTKTYWAAVGSGPNKAAADEIRIKLSELCYKTISSDYIEDKKHIDLSSEPLILMCAAGANGSVIGDIIKDTAIFKAHKAAPVVIADEGENRFAPYAEDVLQVPAVQSHLAPILNTLAGHLWGYYAALAINDGSLFLHTFREEIRQIVDQYSRDGLDVYEMVLEKRFRENIVNFYNEFRQRQADGRLSATIRQAADLLLLLKYLAGRLPVADFELDFGKKGTALNMVTRLFELLDQSINSMSRPVDAIKHQAKTVTVGTSRITEKIEGLLFESIEAHGIGIDQLTNLNILVLKNLQEIVASINGSILYRIDGLDILGEPTDATTIRIVRKAGLLKDLPSRVEQDHRLQGTKRIIVRQGNVYIGKGRKDDRSILVVPAVSTQPGASNRIEYLLLLNIEFAQQVTLPVKIKALGGKFEHIKNIVQENSLAWQDSYLERIPIEELFGRSAEKIGELIVRVIRG